MSSSPSSGVNRRSFVVGAAAVTAVAATYSSTGQAQAAPRSAPTANAAGDAAFAQQVARTLPLPAADVSSLAATDTALAAGHRGGLHVHSGGFWRQVPRLEGPVYAVCVLGDGFAAVTRRAVAVVSRRGDTWSARQVGLPGAVDAEHALLAGHGTEALLLSGDRLWRLNGQRWSTERLPGRGSALAVASTGAVAVVVGGDTVHERTRTWRQLAVRNATEGWAAPSVGHLAYDSADRLWLAGSQGVAVRDGAGWTFVDARRGLPALGITALLPGADRDVWLTTGTAAMRFDGTRWEYREGRWLPQNTVTAAATSARGDAYLLTPAGVGVISTSSTTLEAKAEAFEKVVDARHRRTPYGFVVSAGLSTPGDLSTATTGPSDNDGLSTGMYGAAQCFRYAVTGSAAAKERAQRAFRALKFLGDVTQGGSHPAPAGFVARAVTPTTDPDPNLRDSVERDRKKRAESDSLWKVMERRWPTSADGKWYWKCDTSSDELDGHYFFYACYFDHVAVSGAERREVVEVVRRLTDHLLDHDLNLVDHDGQPTRWGFFGPQTLNGDPYHREERGLNSLSVLTYLTIADHVVGGRRYAEAKRTLVEEHGYQLNTMHPKVTRGTGGGNTSDDNLAFLLYYHLLGYEPDETLGRTFAKSLSEYWLQVQYEGNPRFHFTTAARLADRVWRDAWGDQPLDLEGSWREDSLDYLRRYPVDVVGWSQTNGGRLDVVPLRPWIAPDYDPGTVGTRSDGLLLPVDERVHHEFNTNIYRFDQGDAGRSERLPVPFLLPYWMGRFHAFV